MTPQPVYAKGQAKPLPALLRDRDKPRLKQYTDAMALYAGTQWPARTAPSQLRRLTMNYLRAITLKTTSYVMTGRSIGLTPHNDSDDATAAAIAAEQALADIADTNGLARLDHATELDTAVLGDGAFKVLWDAPNQAVAITAPDMAGIFPWPHPTDPTRFQRVAHRYQLTATECLSTWGLAPRKDPTIVIEDWTLQTVDIYLDENHTPAVQLVNPYPFIPFVIFPNEQLPKQWAGSSDVIPLQEAAQEINAEVSRVSNILELSGNPITVLEGVDEAKNTQAAPGMQWALPEGAKAYILDLLQHGAITQHIAYFQLLLRALHDLSETPRTAFGDNERDLSGVALQVELQPLLHKVARKRLIRTQAYNLRASYALALLDLFTRTDHLNAGTIVTTWEPPTPTDRTREVEDEIKQVEADIQSRRTAMLNLGAQDPDGEWQRVQEEKRQLETIPTSE